MYDDLLGKRKVKEGIPYVGVCFECRYIRRNKGSDSHLYCFKIKKYVNKGQYGCLKFIQREEDVKLEKA